MAEDDDLENEEVGGGDEGGDEGEAPEGGEKGGKKKVIIIAAVLLLIVGGLAAAFFTGALDSILGGITGGGDDAGDPAAVGEIATGSGIFHELPEVLVNLNTQGRQAQFLKIRVSLEVGGEPDIAIIDRVQDRVMDNFQVYLRELRIEDLQGSAGIYRLREELLRRVRASVAPATVHDVLFKEMLVQ